MFTFLSTYLLFYSFVFVYMCAFLHVLLSVSFCFRIPLNIICRFVRTYSSIFYLYVIFFLNLSGLPPVFIFFPKFYLITECFYSFSLYVAFLFGVYSVLTILYYLQIFNVSEKDFIFTIHFNKIAVYTTTGLIKYPKYYFILSLCWFLFINFYGFFFGLDLFTLAINL